MKHLEHAYKKLWDFHARQCNKHELNPNSAIYAEEQINSLTNVELLEALILWGGGNERRTP
jgi:hypothetical protein